MADTTTTNYGITKVEVGASEDTWGAKLNANADSIDAQMKVNEDAVVVADAKAVNAQSGADLSLKIASDLSDLSDAAAARSNLGLGAAATTDPADYATAAQGALADAAAPLESPTLTGTPSAPTPATSDVSTQIATTAMVQAAVTAAVAAANPVKAWVNFNGQGSLSIRSSFNVASVTDNGVGDFTINFTTNMSSTDYATVTGLRGSTGTGYEGSGDRVYATFVDHAVDSVRVLVQSNGATTARDPFMLSVAIVE